MIRRVLLGLEREDDRSSAVAFARLLVQHGPVQVLLLRIEEWPLIGPLGCGWTPSWRASELSAVMNVFQQDGESQVRVLHAEAVPGTTLPLEAHRCMASLIVCVYHADRTWLRWMSGASAERLFQETSVPLVAVPPSVVLPTAGVSRILYLYSFEDPDEQGFRQLIELAQLFEASVDLVAVQYPSVNESPFFSGFWWSSGREPLASDSRRASESLERHLDILRKRDVQARALPLQKDPLRTAAAIAIRNDADLIVLSRSPATAAGNVLLARRILEAANHPVLLTLESPVPASVPDGPSCLRVGI